ncbi:hypothetical protein BRADI_4g36860v3 [Brachypodium distachyon]|uniref:Uncharacterized protein n=1 Tax=Brachypodium distachyon TaxID=15368 RepID=I1ISE9_BRADI|nr:hypothetical protein BRADI_4g36860v3 [Brachypodium distachyon]
MASNHPPPAPNPTRSQNSSRPMPNRNIQRSRTQTRDDEEEDGGLARQRAGNTHRKQDSQRTTETEERARLEEEQLKREEDILELALDLQAMKISMPGECNLQVQEVNPGYAITSQYNLLLKVSCSGGTPRNISQRIVSVAMAKAWGRNYHLIAEVALNLFMAQFLSAEAMHFVIAKQPCTTGSDNLLIEWLNPNEDSKSNEDYRFETLYVPIRVYGVPLSLRSLNPLQGILKKIGELSDLHALTESMLFAKGSYITGIAKLNVLKPVKDKVKLTISESTSITAYIHDEKIGRICTFCDIMFHTVTHCKKRIELFMERIASKQSAADILFERYGKWMTLVDEIPKETKLESEVQDRNVMLRRFKRLFNPQIEQGPERTEEEQDFNYIREEFPRDCRQNLTRKQLRYEEREVSSASMNRRDFIGREREVEDDTVHPPNYIKEGSSRLGGAVTPLLMHGGHITQGTGEDMQVEGHQAKQQSKGDQVMTEASDRVQVQVPKNSQLESLLQSPEEEMRILQEMIQKQQEIIQLQKGIYTFREPGPPGTRGALVKQPLGPLPATGSKGSTSSLAERASFKGKGKLDMGSKPFVSPRQLRLAAPLTHTENITSAAAMASSSQRPHPSQDVNFSQLPFNSRPSNPQRSTHTPKRHSSPTSILGLPPAKKLASSPIGDAALARGILAGPQSSACTSPSASESLFHGGSRESPLRIELVSLELTGDTRRTDPQSHSSSGRKGGGGASGGSPSFSSRGNRRRHSGWDVPPLCGARGGHPAPPATNASGVGLLAGDGSAPAGEAGEGIPVGDGSGRSLEPLLHSTLPIPGKQAHCTNNHEGSSTSSPYPGQANEIPFKNSNEVEERLGVSAQNGGSSFMGEVPYHGHLGERNSSKVQAHIQVSSIGGNLAEHTPSALEHNEADGREALAPAFKAPRAP